MLAMQDEGGTHAEDDCPRPARFRQTSPSSARPTFGGQHPSIPQLRFPTRTPRKIVSARYSAVGAKFMQPSWRSLQDSSRSTQGSSRPAGSVGRGGGVKHGGGSSGSSVASNVAAGRNTRLKHRFQPTVEELSRALADRPYLTAQIVAVRDDPTLDKGSRLVEIGKIVRECEAPVQASELDRLQANYKPPRERMAGRRAASSAFGQYFKAKVEKEPFLSEAEHPGWREHGGEELAQMLQYVDLIDARYLLLLHEHGGSLPCWGALPAAARLGRASIWRLYGWTARGSLPVVVFSHPWLTKAHPDPEGTNLARLVPVLQTMLPLCGGDKYTVGVLIDYASLPQPTRTHAELTRYKLGLRALTGWLTHPYTPVAFARGAMPLVADGGAAESGGGGNGAAAANGRNGGASADAAGGELVVLHQQPTPPQQFNCRPFEQRGWCEFEWRMACLSKSASCLWDLSLLKPAKLSEAKDDRQRFDLMRSLLLAKVAPPLSPSSFVLMMQKKIKDGRLAFSNRDDVKLVNDLYASGFIKIFEVYGRCDPSGMLGTHAGQAWGEEEARSLAAALQFAAQKCRLQQTSRAVVVNLEGNHFGELGRRLIHQAVQFGKVFAGVRL
jgi:hypothetical protein